MYKYPVLSKSEAPPRIKQGRPISENNDDELIAKGLQKIFNNNYRAVAKTLVSEARDRVWEKIGGRFVAKLVNPSIDPESLIRRLTKKLKEEHTKHYVPSPTDIK